MSWFQSSKCSKCSKCSHWFYTVIHSIKAIFMYEDPAENQGLISPIVYHMKTYSHPTSPIKRSSHTENIEEFNIV